MVIPPQNIDFQCRNCCFTGAERILSKKIHCNFVPHCNCRSRKALYESHRSLTVREASSKCSLFAAPETEDSIMAQYPTEVQCRGRKCSLPDSYH